MCTFPTAEAASKLRAHVSGSGQSAAAASQYHHIEQRLARLLLILDHYAGSEFSMPQALMAPLLGVRRAGVSGAAHNLQAQRLIAYRRGRICVLERRGLEKKSCECYRFIRRQYVHFQRMLPRLTASSFSPGAAVMRHDDALEGHDGSGTRRRDTGKC